MNSWYSPRRSILVVLREDSILRRALEITVRRETLPQRLKLERLGAAIVAGAVLVGASYLADWGLAALKVSGANTVLDKLMIGAAAAVALYMCCTYQAECSARAREKMIMVVELNHHIRNAVTLLGQSAALADGPDKLRLIDEAVDRVDRVLTDLVPTANQTLTPRLFLDDRAKRPSLKPKN